MLIAFANFCFQLVQPSRFLLEHAGAYYEDRTFDVHAQDQWFKDAKFTLGLDFPNLPFYIDGSTKVTQSMAILRVLGRKHGMAPKTEEEYARYWFYVLWKNTYKLTFPLFFQGGYGLHAGN